MREQRPAPRGSCEDPKKDTARGYHEIGAIRQADKGAAVPPFMKAVNWQG